MAALVTRLDQERGTGHYTVLTRRKALHGYWEVGQIVHGADYPLSNLVALEAMGEIVRLEDELAPDGPPSPPDPSRPILSGRERSRRYRERKAQEQARDLED